MNYHEIAQGAGLVLERHDGQFGIEIETESLEEYKIPRMKFWRDEVDGSLRNFGREYISKGPLSLGGQLEEALTEFKDKLNHADFIKDSYSTSVHVHVNTLNMLPIGINNFIVTYILVENILMEFAGDDRKSNLFCLPFKDAEANVGNYEAFLKYFNAGDVRNALRSLDMMRMKYAALNIAPMNKIGTLEVRSFKGTTDVDQILMWTKLLQKIVDYSKRDITPPKIVQKWRDDGAKEFLKDIFGDLYGVISRKDEGDLIKTNVWFAYKILKTCNNWAELNDVFKPKPKMKKAQWDQVQKMAADGIAVDDLVQPAQVHAVPRVGGIHNLDQVNQARDELIRQLNQARVRNNQVEIEFIGEDH